MIRITRIPSGLLIQKDDLELVIDERAIDASLGVIIGELIAASTAITAARRSAYEEGLIVGRATGAREERARIEREAEEIASGLALLKTSAPLAA